MTGTPPTVYNGRYELRSQVARGGTAQVYLAHDLLLDRPVALKILDPQLSRDHTFVERFRREAQAAANLSHPNIVPVFDWGESDRTYFIVMEYVDGEPLSSIIRTQAPLDPENSASIATDIAKALSYAHRHGVVHRDVKPGNVLITSDGQVKVTDFGIARAIGADEQVTQTGLVMGTATYFSPEQAQGLGVDGRSDLYALGVVLYEMATGRPPFTGDTPVSIAYQHVREIPPTPRALNPSIPVALEAIILEAMAKVPAERYATADDLRADLERFLRHQPIAAHIPSEYTGTVAPLSPETALLSATTAAPVVRRRPEEKSTTPFWIAGGIALIAILILTAVLGGRALGYFGGTHYAQVPDVRSMSLTAAESKLRVAGFKPDVNAHVAGTPSDQNTITKQSPSYPNTAKHGATVYLTLARKAPTGAVPNVVNQLLPKAKSTLKAAGFNKITETDIGPTSPTQVNNLVTQQSVTGTAPLGSSITLTVVKTTTVTVPLLAGQTEIQAGASLQAAKLTPGTTTQQYSSSVAVGDVISTSPAANTQAAQGSAVNLVVSEGPGANVPDVVGDTESDAITLIRNAGLDPVKKANKGTSDPTLVGTVWTQTPAPGGQVAPGTEVDYRLYVLSGNGATTTLPGNTGTGTSTTTTVPVTGAG